MLREVLLGTAAGAAGTSALNVITYGDMVARGRPASEVPSEVAGELAQDVNLNLAPGGDSQKAGNRKSGLGALLGYATGIGLGALYGLVRPRLPQSAHWFAGVGIGVAAMVVGDGPAILLKKTNPTSWGVAGWLADIIPHLAYGLVTAQVFETLAQPQLAARQNQRRLVRLWERVRYVG
jgi:hypothetical protein